jgi:hypothetical protein
VGCGAVSLCDWSPTFRDNLVVSSSKSTCPMKSWTWRPVPSAPAPSQKKGDRKCTPARAVKTCKWRDLMKGCSLIVMLILQHFGPYLCYCPFGSDILFITIHSNTLNGVKQSLCRSGQDLRAVGGWGCQNF